MRARQSLVLWQKIKPIGESKKGSGPVHCAGLFFVIECCLKRRLCRDEGDY